MTPIAYSKSTKTKKIVKKPVSVSTKAKRTQVQNESGSFVFVANCFDYLDRFLILGTESNTYYSSSQKLTKDASNNLINCIATDGIKTVSRIIEISQQGRAPKNDAALFALAMCLKKGNLEVRRYAARNLPKVARTGTHLFHFAQYVKDIGAFSRLTKWAFAQWYLNMPLDKLAEQVVKYQQRDGWSHKDVIRMAHVSGAKDKNRNEVFKYVRAPYNEKFEEENPIILKCKDLKIIEGFERIKVAKTLPQVLKLISQYDLPRECVPTQYLTEGKVWEALLPHMKVNALVRNLGNMSKAGITNRMSAAEKVIVKLLSSQEELHASRIHPMNLLIAMKVYSSGSGSKGSGTWDVNSNIVDVLEAAFYKSFKNVKTTGQSVMIALDCSASMTWNIVPSVNMTPRDLSAAFSLVTFNAEPTSMVYGFTTGLDEIDISRKDSIEDVIKKIHRLRAGGTNCAAPMEYATKKKLDVDAFVTWTDNETNYGTHPFQALRAFRLKQNKPEAKSVVCAVEASNKTIADPSDKGMLDCVGFDSNVPALISDFISR